MVNIVFDKWLLDSHFLCLPVAGFTFSVLTGSRIHIFCFNWLQDSHFLCQLVAGFTFSLPTGCRIHIFCSNWLQDSHFPSRPSSWHSTAHNWSHGPKASSVPMALVQIRSSCWRRPWTDEDWSVAVAVILQAIVQILLESAYRLLCEYCLSKECHYLLETNKQHV